MSSKDVSEFIPLNIAVLTVSDTRSIADDSSGQLLVDRLTEFGHNLADRVVSTDDTYKMRALVSNWIADDNVHAVIVTGGTGFTPRDNTPQALEPLFDKSIDGFGELFRHISYQDIGTSTVQSRALGGIANQTVIFCLPGSTGACRTGWDDILREQLDNRYRPCNFVAHTKAWDEYCASRG